MALNLKLNTLQANDSRTLQFTDNTGVYSVSNVGGWGSPNLAVTAINGTTHTLELGIRIVTPTSDTTYSYINLYTLKGPFTTIADLVFTINSTNLIYNSSPLGVATDKLPDGNYYVTYVVDRGLASEVTLTYVMLVDGNTRNSVYEKLRTIPTIYQIKGSNDKTINDSILAYAYLKGMESTAYVAKTEELISDLSVLQRLVLYGCDCSW